MPPEKRDRGAYCTTFGHKANHRFSKENVRYYRVDHPIWGDMVGLVAIRKISSHQEIFVNYGYHLQEDWDWSTAVFWYRKEFTNHIRRKLGLLKAKDFKEHMKKLRD